ncbi:MAG: GntR family transcriptional regulator [Eubacteriales bacterium]|jgi:DNA-binding transcriptional regulator YhcF (GntR family)|nr:GntR family transcriptional regulator [Clostridiales bacterium]MDD2442433.1 GntR family transcriptional regulator [Eubacteriales bacterium]MDD4745515.1 GntR family transcriptional regulator [Eubacteriales bacterium]
MDRLFDRLVFDDQSPVYLQIIAFVKQAVAAGDLRQGNSIPSRRGLAAQLGVNPMTVQRAYKQMEDEGLIRTLPNAGSVISVSERERRAVHDELVRDEVGQFVRRMKRMRLPFKDVIDLVSDLWDEEALP